MKWVKIPPTEAGIYFRCNPPINSIVRQDVYKFDDECFSHHPHNEGSQLMNVKDMPDRFLWTDEPIPLPDYMQEGYDEYIKEMGRLRK